MNSLNLIVMGLIISIVAIYYYRKFVVILIDPSLAIPTISLSSSLKSANKHITETDDADLNAAQRELKEFLMESQHEVSRRKEALKKQVETLERDSQEAAEKFNDQVEQQKTKQHDRLMARLKKRQKNKKSAMGNAVTSAINKKKVKSTKVVPVKKNQKRGASKPPPPPPKKKK